MFVLEQDATLASTHKKECQKLTGCDGNMWRRVGGESVVRIDWRRAATAGRSIGPLGLHGFLVGARVVVDRGSVDERFW